jgi:hypothetical protein
VLCLRQHDRQAETLVPKKLVIQGRLTPAEERLKVLRGFVGVAGGERYPRPGNESAKVRRKSMQGFDQILGQIKLTRVRKIFRQTAAGNGIILVINHLQDGD